MDIILNNNFIWASISKSEENNKTLWSLVAKEERHFYVEENQKMQIFKFKKINVKDKKLKLFQKEGRSSSDTKILSLHLEK